MILCGRNGSLEAAAQEFSAEQIAQMASQDAMRRVAQLQKQLEALQRENEDLRQRPAGSAPQRGTAAELATVRQEAAALRAENEALREQQGVTVARPQVDPVLQSQLAALRRPERGTARAASRRRPPWRQNQLNNRGSTQRQFLRSDRERRPTGRRRRQLPRCRRCRERDHPPAASGKRCH